MKPVFQLTPSNSGSYTKAYWFGEYFNPDNSWVSYASSEGYATLTIDRVGNGDSSHPDPITIVQLPYQAEQVHQIIVMARGGTLPLPAPYTGTIFDKIILAGHSLGSVVTNNLNAKYPSDADATLLTGYAIFFPPQFTGVFVQSWLAPAFLDPRFAGYNPDTSSSTTRTTSPSYSTRPGSSPRAWQTSISQPAAPSP